MGVGERLSTLRWSGNLFGGSEKRHVSEGLASIWLVYLSGAAEKRLDTGVSKVENCPRCRRFLKLQWFSNM